MTTPTRRKPAGKRGSRFGSKARRQGYRNAAVAAARSSTSTARSGATRASGPEPLTTKDKAYQLAEAVAGAVVTSYLGAYAVKWGLGPKLVSTAVGIAGGAVAVQSDKLPVRQAATGAASVAGSQLVLLKFGPTTPAPKVVTVAAPAPAPSQVAQLPRPKNVDLGTLPPGMLDAAFERARAELAVTGDGYPPSFGHEAMT